MNRCFWCNLKNPLYVAYHDEEWGVARFDDGYLFEMLVLESFQAGLSWECVLNKRENFRRAFDDFDVNAVAAYDEAKLEALRNDPGIIRNKLKIKAAVGNAKIFQAIQGEYGSFLAYLRQYWDGETIYDCVSTRSPLSDAIAADLGRRGMKFMGTTIVQSFLQAVGIINAHEASCGLYRRAPKAIFFDLDGTLTDSGEGILNCAELALKHFGLPIPSREELRVFVGPPLRQSFARFGVPADGIETAIEVYRSRYNPIGIFENTPYPGIRELLEKLRAQGHRLYVATSKPEEMALRILERFELADYFDLICGATMDKARDTKAAVIAYLLEQAGPTANAVMVGDTAFDVVGANVHGIPTIGVSWGYGSEAEMQEAGAAAIAQDPDELFALLQE